MPHPLSGRVGIGYRTPLRAGILAHRGEIGFVEVLTESFLRNRPALRALASLVPCVPHSLGLSVASTTDDAYLAGVAGVVEASGAPFHTDHLAFTREGATTIGHLAPAPCTGESLRVVVSNVRKVQSAIGLPFALENIAMPFYWPEDEMPQEEFLARLVRETGCLLLLDLENVRINAANHARAARRFLDGLPLEAVAQVHVAGGTHGGGREHDTHSAPVSDETWALLRDLCDLVPPPAVLIERDADFPPFPEMLAEVRAARAIVEAAAA